MQEKENFVQSLETLAPIGELYVRLLVAPSFNAVILHIHMSET
jgi:hypothetical protein